MSNKMHIVYLCDGLKCENGSCKMDIPDDMKCKHTSDITHAKNFKEIDTGKYMEVDHADNS